MELILYCAAMILVALVPLGPIALWLRRSGNRVAAAFMLLVLTPFLAVMVHAVLWAYIGFAIGTAIRAGKFAP